MSFFDLFKFVVRIRTSNSGFFCSLVPHSKCGAFLCKISSDPAGCKPSFSVLPILYPFRSSLFLVRELKRTGYHVSVVPFLFLFLRSSLAAFILRLKARKAAKAKWK